MSNPPTQYESFPLCSLSWHSLPPGARNGWIFWSQLLDKTQIVRKQLGSHLVVGHFCPDHLPPQIPVGYIHNHPVNRKERLVSSFPHACSLRGPDACDIVWDLLPQFPGETWQQFLHLGGSVALVWLGWLARVVNNKVSETSVSAYFKLMIHSSKLFILLLFLKEEKGQHKVEEGKWPWI